MIFLWCNTATAESKLPPCQGEDHKQWTNCFGTYLKKDLKRDGLTRDYTGEFGNIPGEPEGKGTGKVYKNENLLLTFDLEYKNGKAIRGTIIRANGEKYVGELKNNKYHGQGTFTKKGAKWVGEWKDGKLQGRGTAFFSNGNKYIGEWKDNIENGQGTHTWANGDKYVGEFKDGKSNGQGTYTWSNGDKFVGEFKDGKKDGQGTMTIANGDKFVGEYKDDKRNGQGTYVWVDGNKEVALYNDGEVVKIISSTVKKASSSSNTLDDEQKIRQYIQQREEMKRNCDGMWSLRELGGQSESEIIALCKPLGYDVKSKTWRYEPESVKEVLRQYGIYD